jgi:hypothetical protein
MKTVYRYKVYDINSDTEIVAATYATKGFIEQIVGAKILFETEINIEDNHLDGNGIYKIVSESRNQPND